MSSNLEVVLRDFLADVVRQVVREELRLVVGQLQLTNQQPEAVPPQAMTDGYVTAAEAARFLSITAPTVREWSARGHLRAYRAGRQLRFRLADLHGVMHGGPPREKPPPTTEEEVNRILAYMRDSAARECGTCKHAPVMHAHKKHRCRVKGCSCQRWVPKTERTP